MAKSKRLRQAKKKEDEWSRVDLPSPPLLTGRVFYIWKSKMRAYLRYVDTLLDLNDEAKYALALHPIQQAVDDSLMHKIVAVKTSKEAWSLLEENFSERGSCHDEATIAANEESVIVVEDEATKCADEVIEDFVNQAEPDKFENSEAHCAEPQVDEDDKDDVGDEEVASPIILDDDEVAIAAAENVEVTQVVAGKPSKVGCEEEMLMKSMPMRAQGFSNKWFDYECAGTYSNQPADAKNEEQKARTKYDDENLSTEERQNLEIEMNLIADLLNGRTAENENSAEDSNNITENDTDDCPIVDEACILIAEAEEKESSSEAATKRQQEGSKEAAKLNEEEGSPIAAKHEENDKNESLITAIEPAKDEKMEEQNDDDEEEPVEDIFVKWSPEEIRHYYQLMWKHANEEDENRMKDENSMWDLEIPTTYELSMLKLEFEDEHTWQQFIEELEDIDGRIKLKQLEEKQKKKTKMKMKKLKKKTQRITVYKVWSKTKKKKKLPEQRRSCTCMQQFEFLKIVSLAET